MPAFAILPPLHEGIREIKALLSDERLYSYLHSGEVLEAIKKIPEGYLVITNQSEILVSVVYQKEFSKMGPAIFELQFSRNS